MTGKLPDLPDLPDLPELRPEWPVCHRLIATHFPTSGLFDGIADARDLDVVVAIQALTNPGLRQELGELSLVPADQRIVGLGATLIMSAFTHLNPLGSRFSDGSYGAYYAAESLETAVAEVGHHRTRFLARTSEPAIEIGLRWIRADLAAALHDLRGVRQTMAEIYDPEDYSRSRALGRRFRERGSAGLTYWSVRRATGQCIAVFRPNALRRASARDHIALHWDGQRISHWYRKDAPNAL